MRQKLSAYEGKENIITKELLKVGSDINTKNCKKNIYITESNKVEDL